MRWGLLLLAAQLLIAVPAAAYRPPPLLDLDGRLYRSRVIRSPWDVIVIWPAAPRPAHYVLHVRSRRGVEQTWSLAEPRASIELRVGQYTMWMEADTGQRSPETRFELGLDFWARRRPRLR